MEATRFLICRLSHMGDCILTLPVLNAIRDRFPDAFLAWIVEPPSDQILRGHKALDELIVVQRGWMKSATRLLALRHQLRSLRIDATIDPQSLTKSALPAFLSGAKHRVGFARGTGRELAPILNNQNISPKNSHMVEKSLELLRPLGIFEPRVEFSVPMDNDAQSRMQTYIRHSHLSCGFAVLNPGAGWHSRRWPARRYATVARHLGEHHGIPSVVTWAGAQEQQWAQRIVQLGGGHALAAPATSVTELSALMAVCRMFVGSDTGPLHLAAALDVPCVGLYGTTKPENSGPHGAGHVVVQSFYQAGTSRQRRHADNEAMMAIDAMDVCKACDRLLTLQTKYPRNAA